MSRRLAPVAAAFVCFGMFWGTWAVAAIDVERFLRVSHAGLGALLALAAVAAVATNAVGGPVAERWGTRLALAGFLTLWATLALGLALLHQRWAFSLVFVAFVAAGGGVDVVMNVSATAALGTRPGRLLRFHALFNAGAVAGAALTGALLHAGISWRAVWAGIAVAAWSIAALCLISDLPAGGSGERHPLLRSAAAVREAGLLVLATAFAGAALVEGGIDTWGVLFLRSRLAAGILVGAGAYVVGQSLATVARTSLSRPAEAVGGARGATIGAALAGAGLALEAAAPSAALGAAGLALAAIGISTCWPLLLAEAGRGSDRPGVIVGGVTAAGYVGFVAGPPVVGWIAGAWGLRAGIGALALAAFGAAVLSRRPTGAPAPVSG